AVMREASRPCVPSVRTTLSARVLAVFWIDKVYVSLPSVGSATIAPVGSAVLAALTCRVSVPGVVSFASVLVAVGLLFVQLVSGAMLQVGSTTAVSVAVPVGVPNGTVALILMVALASAASADNVMHLTVGKVTVHV